LPSQPPPVLQITGRVTDDRNNPLFGATIVAKNSNKATLSDVEGKFYITGVAATEILQVSHVGFIDKMMFVKAGTSIEVNLQLNYSPLDETVIMAYGKTTKKLNTGNITKVVAEDIFQQPVTNVLAALEGRVPGMIVTQSSGVPGAAIKMEIRGQNSILQGSDPLFIIDGVPFSAGNASINILTNSAGSAGLSPFNLVDPSQVESIEVLKDADATAIYGSRGANGVILITTKKAKAGQTSFNASVRNGVSTVTRTMNMLHTGDYLQMRREAFQNDGVTPTLANAPDLLSWDTTKYTDFKKLFIGGTAHTYDVNASLSAGNTQTSFLLASAWHQENTVFPGDLSNQRENVHLNVNHHSADNKFSLVVDAGYSNDHNNLIATDLTGYINLPPHIHLYDSLGNLNWKEGGTAFRNLFGSNPLSLLERKYKGTFQNLQTSSQFSFNVLPNLNLKANLGYNSIMGDEVLINPKTSIDPASSSLAFSNFGNSNSKTWIIEPQAEYEHKIGKGRFKILVGSTYQGISGKTLNIAATNYTSDLLLYNTAAAGNLAATNFSTEYKYAAIFGRIQYNLRNTLLVNLSGRRDGSSRFGPENRYTNFGAAGVAWIFSSTKWTREHLKILSFGKLRGSFGITGNDQIGDYQYLDTWTNSNPPTYQNTPGLRPSRLFNPGFSWEVNKKKEAGLELGFINNRLFISISYYNHLSGNQLVNYSLPVQTGFSSITKNLDATVRNTGWEFLLNSNNVSFKSFNWKTALNLTVAKNKLLSFPGLASSSYANTYVIGEPLSVKKTYGYSGVDPQAGIYQFFDIDSNGILNNADKVVLKNTTPKFYGGFQNSFSYKKIELSIFFEFRKQLGRNYLYTQGLNVPGYGYINQPVIVLNRWQKPGMNTTIQKFTQAFNSPAYTAAYPNLLSSEAIYSDASYIRCKNISLQYSGSSAFLRQMHIQQLRIYLLAQNLFMITNYVGADPENQSLYILPPLKTLVAGLSLTF
jgi:TonB-dependent starch-binding outer membrane protein SusC